MEFISGYGLAEAERICSVIINNNNLASRVRGEFWGKLGSCWLSKSMGVVGVNRSKAIDHLRQSIAAYMEAVRLGRGRDDISMTFDWMERPVERIMHLTGNDVGEIFAVVEFLLIESRISMLMRLNGYFSGLQDSDANQQRVAQGSMH
jgi:hypothetical protein